MEKQRLLLTVQDTTGHSEAQINWDPKDPEQVKAIQEMFIEMKKKGFIFFKVENKKKLKVKGKQIKDFDPKLETMFMEKNLDWEPVENESTETQNAEYVDVEKEEIEADSQYVAAQPLAGG